MNTERMLMVLDRPHVSEKTTIIAEKLKKFTFRVVKTATKHEVKKAVEYLFNVKVDKVSILNVKGKTKRFKQMTGKRSNWKKAYVSLQQGYDIDLSTAE